ncbi:MAG: YbgF trimerization domain-containing protein, partial [Acidiferrobacterales bacterium]
MFNIVLKSFYFGTDSVISSKAPRNFARCFSLAIVLLVWQGAVFAIDRLPDRRSSKSSTSKSVASSASGQLSASTESLVELLGQVDSLQNELQELRNQSEVQAYEIERLKKQQKDVLRDLDERLGRLERGEKSLTRTGTAGTITIIEKPPVKAGTGSVTNSGAKSASKVGTTGKRPAAKPLGTKNKATSQAKKEYDAAFALLKQG